MSHLGFSIHNDAGREVAFLSYFQCTPDEADHVADLLCYGLPESKMELRIYQRSVAAETARMFGNRAPAPEPSELEIPPINGIAQHQKEMGERIIKQAHADAEVAGHWIDPDEARRVRARRLAGQIVTDRGERNV